MLRAIHAERMLARAAEFPFWDEGPVVLAGAVAEKVVEGGFHRAFVADAEAVELAESRVVSLDGLMRRFEGEPRHDGRLTKRR